MAIHFYTNGIKYTIQEKKKIKRGIKAILNKEERTEGQINIILTSDTYLKKLNKKYLNKDYYTDIITFDYSRNNYVLGELFISLERVKENAKNFKIRVRDELIRVIFHGILHMSGYKDSTFEEKVIMTEKEDYYIGIFNEE